MSLNEELKSWSHGFLMTLTTYAEEILNFGEVCEGRQSGVCCVGSAISSGGIMPFYSTPRLTDLSKKSKYILPHSDPTSIFL